MRRLLVLMSLAVINLYGKVNASESLTDLNDFEPHLVYIGDSRAKDYDESYAENGDFDGKIDQFETEPDYDDIDMRKKYCKKGGYYKPNRCNVCYCNENGEPMCTNVMCLKITHEKKLLHKTNFKNKYKKLSAAINDCVPPAIVTMGKCKCACKLPSVAICPETCFK